MTNEDMYIKQKKWMSLLIRKEKKGKIGRGGASLIEGILSAAGGLVANLAVLSLVSGLNKQNIAPVSQIWPDRSSRPPASGLAPELYLL